MGAKTIKHKIVDVLMRNPNQPYHKSMLAELTGLREHQVMTTMARLVAAEGTSRYIDVIDRSTVWSWRSVPRADDAAVVATVQELAGVTKSPARVAREKMRAHSPATFEYVGSLASGELLLKANTGTMYKAVEL